MLSFRYHLNKSGFSVQTKLCRMFFIPSTYGFTLLTPRRKAFLTGFKMYTVGRNNATPIHVKQHVKIFRTVQVQFLHRIKVLSQVLIDFQMIIICNQKSNQIKEQICLRSRRNILVESKLFSFNLDNLAKMVKNNKKLLNNQIVVKKLFA